MIGIFRDRLCLGGVGEEEVVDCGRDFFKAAASACVNVMERGRDYNMESHPSVNYTELMCNI